MKFNEKLIKLRRQSGLSQEELGYKLNVTRQTVSKWELGQTTPEMDKLVSLSKVYGITLDELTSEEETMDVGGQDPIKTENNDKKKFDIKNMDMRKILIPLIIVLVIIALIIGANKMKIFNKAANEIVGVNNEIISEDNLFISFINFIKEIITGQVKEQLEDNKLDEIKRYNSKFETYNGTQSGYFVENLLELVVTNNKTKKDHLITVKYNQNETNVPDEIKGIKPKLEKFDEYEVTLDYDDNGYVNKVTIEYINQSEINKMKEEIQKNVQEYDKQVEELKESVMQNFN